MDSSVIMLCILKCGKYLQTTKLSRPEDGLFDSTRARASVRACVRACVNIYSSNLHT